MGDASPSREEGAASPKQHMQSFRFFEGCYGSTILFLIAKRINSARELSFSLRITSSDRDASAPGDLHRSGNSCRCGGAACRLWDGLVQAAKFSSYPHVRRNHGDGGLYHPRLGVSASRSYPRRFNRSRSHGRTQHNVGQSEFDILYVERRTTYFRMFFFRLSSSANYSKNVTRTTSESR